MRKLVAFASGEVVGGLSCDKSAIMFAPESAAGPEYLR